MEYDRGQVCLNGHPINARVDTRPHHDEKRCGSCGEPTITACPACEAPLRGGLLSGGSAWRPGAYCHECGKTYPWTQRRMDAIDAVIAELEGLSLKEIERLKQAVPAIVAATPQSNLAVLLLKQAFAKMNKISAEVLTRVLKDSATAFIKRELGL